jgi:hypothetical protein
MELETFVSETIVAISNGVCDARDKSQIWVAPGKVEGKEVTTPQMIDSEVAITASTDGGGKINVASMVEAGAETSRSNEHRIRFSVPVYFQAPKR